MSTASNLTLRLAQAVQHAGALYGAGQWDQSEQVCKQILAVRADYFEALSLLGLIAAQTARMDEAEGLLRRAARTRPADAAVHNNYGNVLLALGRPGDALQSYSRALAINPSYPDAHNNHGIALKDLGRFEDALQSFDRALSIKQDFAEGHNNRGLVLYELKRLGEAITSYEAALRLAPNFAEAHSNRGDALHALKRYSGGGQRATIGRSPSHRTPRPLTTIAARRCRTCAGWMRRSRITSGPWGSTAISRRLTPTAAACCGT